MTNSLHPTRRHTPSASLVRGKSPVIPLVASRPSPLKCPRRSRGISRLWREGTDPAPRGTTGRRQERQVLGVAP